MGPVVYASSIAALKADAEYPSTLYGVFKLANEGTAAGYFDDFGVPSVGLRPHTIYGPGRDQGLTSAPTAAMVAAARGEAYEIPFGGSLQLQYVADAGEAFVRASEVPAEGASVHNLDGPVASVEEIVAAIEAAEPERRADHLGRGPAAVPARGGLELVHRPDRRPTARPLTEGVAESIERSGRREHGAVGRRAHRGRVAAEHAAREARLRDGSIPPAAARARRARRRRGGPCRRRWSRVAVADDGERAAAHRLGRDVADHQPAGGAGEAPVGHERDRLAEPGADHGGR